jgi:peptidoglycan-associated lipoprotein
MNTRKVLTVVSALGALAMLSACASKSTGPDVVATGPSQGSTTSAVVPGSQADLEQAAGHRVFFGYDQYNLTAQGQSSLQRQAQWLKQYPNTRIVLSGNCDERGTREYNLALGERRADSIRSYLTSSGVAARQMETVSYGEERPTDPGHDDSAWSRNRRAVLQYR